MKELEYVLPGEIEKRSFEIIGQELKEMHITIPADEEPVTKRVIHTSADFEYAHTMTYSKNAVQIAKQLIANGADIVTDTNMALAGINKKVLARYGGVAHCFMADEEVARIAKSRQVTRATVSMEKAAQIQKPVIFAVGNAPTALVSLYELMQKKRLETGIYHWCSGRICQCGSRKGTDFGNGCTAYCESRKKRRQQRCRCDCECNSLRTGQIRRKYGLFCWSRTGGGRSDHGQRYASFAESGCDHLCGVACESGASGLCERNMSDL